MELTVPYNYLPRTYQAANFADYEDRNVTRFMNCWHRRSGKDKTWINFTVMRMLERKGLYFHILPTYTQAKTLIWEGIGKDGFPFIEHFPKPLVLQRNETELKIVLQNGSIWKLAGSDRIDLLVGSNPVGCVLSEFALQTPEAWRLLSPILLENGGWASFIFTPRGKNHAYDLWMKNRDNPRWHASLLTIRETHRDAGGEDGNYIMTKEDVEQEIREGTIDEDTAQQEYYCSFEGTFQGSYYGKILSGLADTHFVRCPYDPRYPVDTVWDLGRSDANSIWFVQSIAGREFRCIDYLQREGEDLGFYIKYVKELPYSYGSHWAPHDIEVAEYSTGTKRIDHAKRLGINFRVVPKVPLQDGIQAVRRILPVTYFDYNKCAVGLDSLANYHKEWDEKKQIFMDNPVHDKWSHGADAFRYFAVICDRIESEHMFQPDRVRVITEFNPFEEEDKELY